MKHKRYSSRILLTIYLQLRKWPNFLKQSIAKHSNISWLQRNSTKQKVWMLSKHWSNTGLCIQQRCDFSWHDSILLSIVTEIIKSICEDRKKYSRLSLSRIPRDSLKYFEISVLRHVRFAELRKKLIRLITFNKYMCNWTLEVRDILKILWKRGEIAP